MLTVWICDGCSRISTKYSIRTGTLRCVDWLMDDWCLMTLVKPSVIVCVPLICKGLPVSASQSSLQRSHPHRGREDGTFSPYYHQTERWTAGMQIVDTFKPSAMWYHQSLEAIGNQIPPVASCGSLSECWRSRCNKYLCPKHMTASLYSLGQGTNLISRVFSIIHWKCLLTFCLLISWNPRNELVKR